MFNFFATTFATVFKNKTIIINTIPRLAAESISPFSFVKRYACTVKFLALSNMLPGICATVPAVNNIAADSPITRPTDNITPDNIPGIALGNTTLYNVWNLVDPKANDASLYP